MKKNALINSVKYSASQKLLTNRFFNTIKDFGGRLAMLADIVVDEIDGDSR